MNEELDLVYRYCAANKLSINFKKTHYMIISPRKDKPPINIPGIKYKSNIKYLGVILDDQLNWTHHLKHVNNKLIKNTGIICKLRHLLNLKTLKQIYYNLIYPYLTYGLLSWGNNYRTKLTKIETKQNKVIKCIFFANARESARPYYKLLDLLNLESLFKLQTACLAYKIFQNTQYIPDPLSKHLQQVSDVHSYHTIFSSQLNLTQLFKNKN